MICGIVIFYKIIVIELVNSYVSIIVLLQVLSVIYLLGAGKNVQKLMKKLLKTYLTA